MLCRLRSQRVIIISIITTTPNLGTQANHQHFANMFSVSDMLLCFETGATQRCYMYQYYYCY